MSSINSPSVTELSLATLSARALKVTRSRTIRKKPGLARLRFCAKSAGRLRRPYSMRPPPMEAAKLMSDLAMGTSSASNSFTRFG